MLSVDGTGGAVFTVAHEHGASPGAGSGGNDDRVALHVGSRSAVRNDLARGAGNLARCDHGCGARGHLCFAGGGGVVRALPRPALGADWVCRRPGAAGSGTAFECDVNAALEAVANPSACIRRFLRGPVSLGSTDAAHGSRDSAADFSNAPSDATES